MNYALMRCQISSPLGVTAIALAILVAISGCGSSVAGSQAPEPESPASAPESTRSELPAHRARVFVSTAGSSARDNWTDIEVPGDAGLARRVCGTVTDHQMQFVSRAGLTGRVGRACETTPLPPVQNPGGGYLLVNQRVLTAADLLLMMADEPTDLPEGAVATITDFSAFSTDADCQRMRSEFVARQRADRAEATEAARSWLLSQLTAQEDAATRACDLERDVQQRCADLADANDADRICRAAPRSDRCRRLKEAARERIRCETELNVQHRECENGRALAEMLRGRLENEPTEDEPPSPPECRRAR